MTDRDHTQHTFKCPRCGKHIAIEAGDFCPCCDFDFDDTDYCDGCEAYQIGAACCGDCADGGG